MTCNDSYEYRSVIFENQSNDTIITWSSGWKPTTPEAVIEYYSDEWATQIPPHEHSVESWVDEEDIMVYIFVIKKADRDLYSQKEIVEKGLAELLGILHFDQEIGNVALFQEIETLVQGGELIGTYGDVASGVAFFSNER